MSDDTAEAGWYEDPEHPGQLRFWDGAGWTDRRQPAPGSAPPPPPPGASAPPPPPPPGGYAASAPGQVRYGDSNANTALGLSIAGILCCGPLAIAGLIMGRSEVQAIDRGSGDPTKRGTANAAFIIGVIAVVIWALVLIGGVAVG